MGRPERSLDPGDSPLSLLAADLRAAREAAGNPTYRAMARVAHRSRTTLSEAAGGRTPPTWETVQAFLRACDVPPTGAWRERWERCATAPAEPERPETARPRSRTPLLVACAMVVVGAIAVVLIAGHGESPPAVPSIANGADPEDTGCANDPQALTVDAREVDLDTVPVGVVELRYSPRCGVSWPRFTPADPRYAAVAEPGPVEAHLSVIADDGHGEDFSVRYVGLPVFGNVLNSTRDCVRAEVYLSGPDWRSATGRTGCFRGQVEAGR
jgi:helix-turn-helix protein/uncharacterized protein DUF2690